MRGGGPSKLRFGGAFDFFFTTNAQRAPSQTSNRPSPTMEIDPATAQRCARQQDGPRICPAPTPACTYGNPNRKPGRTTPDRGPAHQENEVCNNYSVISTRLCLFNHNRHRALSTTCNPTPRPKLRRVFVSQYIYIRTLIPAQNVPRGTLYVQPWATGRCGSRRKTPSSGRTWANRLGVGIALLTDCGV